MTNIGGFDEGRSEFEGFNAFYNEKISPYLESREQERSQAVAKAKIFGASVFCVGIALSIFLYLRIGSPFALIIPLVVSGVAGFGTMHPLGVRGIDCEAVFKVTFIKIKSPLW